MGTKSKQLGSKVVSILKKRGLSRLWLSTHFKCSNGQVSRRLKGVIEMDIADLQTISKALDLEINIGKNSIEIKEL